MTTKKPTRKHIALIRSLEQFALENCNENIAFAALMLRESKSPTSFCYNAGYAGFYATEAVLTQVKLSLEKTDTFNTLHFRELGRLLVMIADTVEERHG